MPLLISDNSLANKSTGEVIKKVLSSLDNIKNSNESVKEQKKKSRTSQVLAKENVMEKSFSAPKLQDPTMDDIDRGNIFYPNS